VSEGWRKANVFPSFKKDKKKNPGKYRLISLTSIPVKVLEQLILETNSRHVKDKEVCRNSQQHGFTKGKSCLTSLITCDEITVLVDEGRAVDVVCLDFSKAFDTTSLLVRRLLEMKYRLCK